LQSFYILYFLHVLCTYCCCCCCCCCCCSWKRKRRTNKI